MYRDSGPTGAHPMILDGICLGIHPLTLLDYRWIGCVLLLGEGRQSRLPIRLGSLLSGFSLFPPGVLGWFVV
jgi:hypothetical protein